jgi:hypothetical protein
MKLQEIKDYRKELKKAGIKKSERRETTQYLKGVRQTQQKEQSRYSKLLFKQESAFADQIASQGQFLDRQLSTIASQSAEEVGRYESLISRIMQQQESELGGMRRLFDRQNLESERLIASLQTEIQRLSRPASPPKIDVDTRAGIVGISGFQKTSQERQRLGTSGGRRSTRNAPASAFGLETAY